MRSRSSCRATRRRGNRLNRLSNQPLTFRGQLFFVVATGVCRSDCCFTKAAAAHRMIATAVYRSDYCSAVVFLGLSSSALVVVEHVLELTVLIPGTCTRIRDWYCYDNGEVNKEGKKGHFTCTTSSFRAKTRGCYLRIPWAPRGWFSLIPHPLNEHVITCHHISRSAATVAPKSKI